MRKIILVIFILAILPNVFSQKHTNVNGNQQQQSPKQSPTVAIQSSGELNNTAPKQEQTPGPKNESNTNSSTPDKSAVYSVFSDWSFWQFIAAILTAAAAIVYTIFAVKSWREIQKQAAAAREVVERMDAQFQIMDDGLTQNRNIVQQNERVIGVLEGQLRQLGNHEIQMIGQAEIMKGQIEATKDTLIYSQCAYVTASIDRVDGDIWYLRIENGGNTPANKVIVNYNFGWMTEAPECCRWDGENASWSSTISKIYGVIAPKQFYLLRIDRLNSHAEGEKFYCWGTIDYSDIFQVRSRQSKFAFVRSLEDSDGTPCEGFNEAY